MPENLPNADTPSATPAPAVAVVDTPPAPAPSVTDPTPDSVLQDLMGTPTPDPATPSGDGAPPAGDAPPPAADDDDPALIRMREDYLKRLNKLQEREQALKDREEALKNGKEPEPPAADPNEPLTPGIDPATQAKVAEALNVFNTELDPESFQHASDQELVKHINAVKLVGDRLAQMVVAQQEEIQQLKSTQGTLAQSHQMQQAQVIHGMLTTAVEQVEQKFGLSATVEELGASLKTHAKALADKNGGVLPPDAALRAYIIDNYDVVMKAQAKPSDPPKPAEPPAPPAPSVPNGERPKPTPTNVDDQILAELMSG